MGSLVQPGSDLGTLEVLGRAARLVAPADAYGVVVAVFETERARSAVDFHTELLRLDPRVASGASLGTSAATDDSATAEGLAFRAPMSGRFYARPTPDADPFVTVGDTLKTGQTICLLEVMKTFNRVSYGGPGLPPSVRVVEVVVGDGDDVDEGAILLRLSDGAS